MPIDFTKSKYSEKARKFLSKDPLEFPLLTNLCGSVRSGKTINIIIIPGKRNYDMKLIQVIVKSFWYNKLGAERKLPPEARNGNNKRLRKLRFLPPEIIESIMNGTQDPELNVKKLIEMAEKSVL